jgi:hypothetical protein
MLLVSTARLKSVLTHPHGRLFLSSLDTFRMRTFNLLRGTYTAIPLEKVQGYLGLEAEVVLQGANCPLCLLALPHPSWIST